jgi:hypothetical protein
MLQERIFKEYPSVKIPESFQEQERGFFLCCENIKVLAGNGLESWKNDVESAWIKLSQPSDTFEFILRKSGVETVNYTPVSVPFVEEPDAFYCTIKWADVLALEGPGTYQIIINYDIGGISGEIVWRNFTYCLKEYTISNALETARIRAIFNLEHEIEGINFTGSNVESSLRFHGQIKKDQPNHKRRNVVQQNRRIEPVISENQQTWLMITDGYTDPILSLIENLYLLSANELFIADYNAHTNSYDILDREVTMLEDETPEREPVDEFARQDVLTCKVGDRFRNKKTYY